MKKDNSPLNPIETENEAFCFSLLMKAGIYPAAVSVRKGLAASSVLVVRGGLALLAFIHRWQHVPM